MAHEPIPFYEEHPGTLRIAGKTNPIKTGWCAFFFLRKGIQPIDFFCIGANANQQATKAMFVFRNLVSADESMKSMFEVAFLPLLFQTKTRTEEQPDGNAKNATVWRVLRVGI